jgi:exopolysaccharide production protein ExoQ
MQAIPGWTNAQVLRRSGEPSADAPLYEQGLFALWVLSTFTVFAGNELILYPLALYFIGMFALNRRQLVPIAAKAWPLFLMPILATLSWAWSPSPNAALKFGIMMNMTVLVSLYIGARFAPHQVIRSVFVAGVLIIFMAAPGFIAGGGVWGDKNIFAIRMLVVMVTAMAVAYNRSEIPLLRLAAFPFIPIAFYLIVIAESATSLVFALVSFMAMTTIWLFWSGLRNVRHARSMLVLIGVFAVMAGLLVLSNMTREANLFEAFVTSLGKDTTLTGRTMLWEAADKITEEKPLLGTGAEGFWLWGHGQAYTLLELSYKPAGTRFSFHNSYLETQVHLGFVGLWCLILAVAWCLMRTVVAWFQTQTVVRSYFLLITMVVLVSSFTESWMFNVFDTAVMLFYISAFLSLVRRDHVRAENSRLADMEDDWTGGALPSGLRA